MIYEWGAKHYKADANVIGAEIERITEKHGAADAAQILDAARSKRSPLHPLFTWDDSTAAEAWRRSEARTLTSSLVVVEVAEEQETRRPAFYHVNYTTSDGDEVTGYQPVSVVVKNVDSRESAAAELLMQLRGLQRRYEGLGDLFEPVWREVTAIEEKVAA